MKWKTVEEAVQIIKSGDRVFIHGGAATPKLLVKAMADRYNELRRVEIVSIHTEGEAAYARPEMAESFYTNAFFVGANIRAAVDEGVADYVPVFLSEISGLFRNGIMPLDVALVQVSPPDRHGFCSLGVSVDVSRAAVQMAKHVIAQINPNMPRSHGDGLIHISHIDSAVVVDDPLPDIAPGTPTDGEREIGRFCAELIEDGATLQMGIGAIPNSVLAALTHHRDLGIHTEMFSDGAIDLIERGIVNNERKRIHPGKVVASFAMGTRRLYDFIDDNPQVVMLDVAYVNDTAVIRRNPRVTAINSAIEVDLTGQVGADSMGTRQYSGVGGQMDFVRGAALSEGGKPIIALPSTAADGQVSRIAAAIKPGAGVVTTRGHVHWVVTEYGAVDLFGMSLRQRAEALISIAHPDFRAELRRYFAAARHVSLPE